jgi:hypothetical protein
MQYVVVLICKIPAVEDDRLDADVRSAGSGMDGFSRHVVLRGPSFEIVPFLMQHRVSISTAPILHLQ